MRSSHSGHSLRSSSGGKWSAPAGRLEELPGDSEGTAVQYKAYPATRKIEIPAVLAAPASARKILAAAKKLPIQCRSRHAPQAWLGLSTRYRRRGKTWP